MVASCLCCPAAVAVSWPWRPPAVRAAPKAPMAAAHRRCLRRGSVARRVRRCCECVGRSSGRGAKPTGAGSKGWPRDGRVPPALANGRRGALTDGRRAVGEGRQPGVSRRRARPRAKSRRKRKRTGLPIICSLPPGACASAAADPRCGARLSRQRRRPLSSRACSCSCSSSVAPPRCDSSSRHPSRAPPPLGTWLRCRVRSAGSLLRRYIASCSFTLFQLEYASN